VVKLSCLTGAGLEQWRAWIEERCHELQSLRGAVVT
jgi:hypothetical protein